MRTLVFVWGLLFATTLHAQGTGELTGRFVLDGPLPQPARLANDKGLELYDESLLVDLETYGIANIVVYLYLKPGEEPPKHPESVRPTARIVAKDYQYRPHISVVHSQAGVIFQNADAHAHHFESLWFDIQLDPRGETAIPRPRRLYLPDSITNRLYPWMRGYYFVTDHPFVAVTDATGRFTVPDLPPGEWTFHVWHERTGYIENVVDAGGQKAEWPKGRFTVTIKPGENDLGWISITPEELEPPKAERKK